MGGIGEHDARLRSEAVRGLACIGLRLDETANQAAQGSSLQPIHADDSEVQVWEVPVDEGRVAALAAWNWLQSDAPH